jgi:hypothetical protein
MEGIEPSFLSFVASGLYPSAWRCYGGRCRDRTRNNWVGSSCDTISPISLYSLYRLRTLTHCGCSGSAIWNCTIPSSLPKTRSSIRSLAELFLERLAGNAPVYSTLATLCVSINTSDAWRTCTVLPRLFLVMSETLSTCRAHVHVWYSLRDSNSHKALGLSQSTVPICLSQGNSVEEGVGFGPTCPFGRTP